MQPIFILRNSNAVGITQLYWEENGISLQVNKLLEMRNIYFVVLLSITILLVLYVLIFEDLEITICFLKQHYFSIGVYLQIINLSQVFSPTIVISVLHNQTKFILVDLLKFRMLEFLFDKYFCLVLL